MKYLLDTNVCIRYLNQRSLSVVKRIKQIPWIDITVCSAVKAEMYAGARRSNTPAKTLTAQRYFMDAFVSFSFDDIAAEHYAIIHADFTSSGQIIGSSDLMIAAIALANNLILVTHNTAEFSRVKGLRWEDWEAPSP